MRYLTTEEMERALAKIDKVDKSTMKAIENMRSDIKDVQSDIENFKTEMLSLFADLRQEFLTLLTMYKNEQEKRKTALLKLTENTEESV